MREYMVLIRPFLGSHSPFSGIRTKPDATVYVKERAYFVEQGGDTADWGKAWEEVEVMPGDNIADEIEAAREIGMAMGIERAKELL